MKVRSNRSQSRGWNRNNRCSSNLAIDDLIIWLLLWGRWHDKSCEIFSSSAVLVTTWWQQCALLASRTNSRERTSWWSAAGTWTSTSSGPRGTSLGPTSSETTERRKSSRSLGSRVSRPEPGRGALNVVLFLFLSGCVGWSPTFTATGTCVTWRGSPGRSQSSWSEWRQAGWRHLESTADLRLQPTRFLLRPLIMFLPPATGAKSPSLPTPSPSTCWSRRPVSTSSGWVSPSAINWCLRDQRDSEGFSHDPGLFARNSVLMSWSCKLLIITTVWLYLAPVDSFSCLALIWVITQK